MTTEVTNGWTHWIFDLDGTLTQAIHDFDAIREELGLEEGQPILEALAQLPTTQAEPLHRRLKELEWDLAKRSQPQEGAKALLAALQQHQCKLGILTRNNRASAIETLRACELLDYFSQDCIIGRNDAAPKPSPEGVLQLLGQWQTDAANAVMIGDFHFDLLAGQQAGTATIYADFNKDAEWSEFATHTIHTLEELLTFLPATQTDQEIAPQDTATRDDHTTNKSKEPDESSASASPLKLTRTVKAATGHAISAVNLDDIADIVDASKAADAADPLPLLAQTGLAQLQAHLETARKHGGSELTEMLPEEAYVPLLPAIEKLLQPIVATLVQMQERLERLETQVAAQAPQTHDSPLDDASGLDQEATDASLADDDKRKPLVFPDTTVTPRDPEHPENAAQTAQTDESEHPDESVLSPPSTATDGDSLRDYNQYADVSAEISYEYPRHLSNAPDRWQLANDESLENQGLGFGRIALWVGLGIVLLMGSKLIGPLFFGSTTTQSRSSQGSALVTGQATPAARNPIVPRIPPRQPVIRPQATSPQPPPQTATNLVTTKRPAALAPDANRAIAPPQPAPARTALTASPAPLLATIERSKAPRPRWRPRKRKKEIFALPQIAANLPKTQRCDLCAKKLYVVLQRNTTAQQQKDFFEYCNALCDRSWYLFRKGFYHWCTFGNLGHSESCPQELKKYSSTYNQQTWLNQ